ncbi:MAG: FAD-dependent monooxygenase [Micrococcus sp.]|nr:FAD-dependent monooxygenase [Micrococcus sp.]
MSDTHVPVLIIGGGGAGLAASMNLSRLGVEHLLVSSLPYTSKLPKAHVLNQRTMEIFTEVGVAPEVYKRSTPAENMKATGWYAGLAGDHEYNGRRLGHLEVWGGGYTDPDYIAASPCRTCNLPQIRLEPVMLEHARKIHADPRGIRFNNEVVGIEMQEDGSALATVLDKDSRQQYTVRAQYVIAADRGRTVGPALGVGMTGPTDLMMMVSVHFSADLTEWATDDDVLIRWLVNPEFGGSWSSGVLVAMGPEHWGPKSEEWVVHLDYATHDPDALQDEKVIDRLSNVLGVDRSLLTVHKVSPWVMEGVVAEKFRVGNVFFIGDAAHRHPPTGGLGLNSAIHDGYNLAWKLALVLQGKAGDALLDTYEAERQPVDQDNVDTAVASAMNHFTIDKALNLSPENTPEQNWAEVMPLWDDSLPGAAEKRHALNKAVGTQTMEFRHHNVEFGYRYDSTAVVDDGSPAYVPLDPVRLYEPSTKPGHPLPHAFVERENERVALGDLVSGGHFLVLAGEDGQDWVDAARKLAEDRGLPVKAHTVGLEGSDYVDVRMAWTKHRGINRGGVVVVRPDRYVAYRSLDAVQDPERALAAAFDTILATGDDAPATTAETGRNWAPMDSTDRVPALDAG